MLFVQVFLSQFCPQILFEFHSQVKWAAQNFASEYERVQALYGNRTVHALWTFVILWFLAIDIGQCGLFHPAMLPKTYPPILTGTTAVLLEHFQHNWESNSAGLVQFYLKMWKALQKSYQKRNSAKLISLRGIFPLFVVPLCFPDKVLRQKNPNQNVQKWLKADSKAVRKPPQVLATKRKIKGGADRLLPLMWVAVSSLWD